MIHDKPKDLTATQQTIIELFAARAGTELGRQKAEAALKQSESNLRAALEERKRISQDLHDSILQSLYAVGLGLESYQPYMKQLKNRRADS